MRILSIPERLTGEVALADDSSALSYGELRHWIKNVADSVSGQGGHYGLVGVYGPAGVPAVASMLGVVAAGFGYVVLDNTYPAGRLRDMIRAAGIELVLTDGPTGALSESGVRALRVIDDCVLGSTHERGRRQCRGPGTVAYAAFTSGTSGRPKGILVPRSAVVAHLKALMQLWPLSPGDRFLQLTPLAFDASVTDIFWPLNAGAAIVVPAPGVHRDPVLIARALLAQRITGVRIPPVLLPAVLEQDDFARCGQLRYLICGGDVLSPAMRDAVLSLLPDVTLLHRYGPTETTVAVTYHQAEAGTPGDFVPLGDPVGGSAVAVLDTQLRSVQAGADGEIWVSGASLSYGYLGQPAATARAFRPDPGGPPGARRYRTGDRARLGHDGQLRFLGREDRQVQLRGLRIELGEIEAVLLSHERVRQAAVAVQRGADPAGDQLAAYVVPSGQVDQAMLREFLRDRLPGYMVPGHLHLLGALPLDDRGKVDQRALAARARGDQEVLAPEAADELTRAIVEAWHEVLGVAPRMGDNFFDLGGHSLLAGQLASRLRRRLRRELTVSDVFAFPTVAGLRATLGERPPLERPAAGDAAIPRRPPGAPIPLTSTQERIWFLEMLRPGSLAYNAQTIFRFGGGLQAQTLRWVLNRLIERHEILRTTFPVQDGQPRQEVHDPRPADLAAADVSALPEADRRQAADRLVASFVRQPFDLTRLPLGRWLMIEIGGGEVWLVQSEHHLIHDGWSLALLTEELLELCAAHREGRPARLAPPPAQFADYACWQRSMPDDQVLAAQLGYWRQNLRSTPELVLPAAAHRPEPGTEPGGCLRVPLSAELTRRFIASCRRLGATEFMAALAVFAAWLYGRTGQSDFAIGVSLANRNTALSEQLVGCLVNNQAIRVRPQPAETMAELTAEVRQSTLACLQNQDVPFHRVVQELRLRRSATSNPVFQVAFNAHSAPYPTNRIPGISFSATEAVSNGTAKFPVHAVLVRHAEKRRSDWSSGDPESLEIHWSYHHDYFTDDDARKSVEEYLRLIDLFIAGDERPLAELTSPAAPGAPAGSEPAEPADGVAPADVISEAGVLTTVCQLCAAVLGLPEVSADANFFDLGGHSLLAVKLSARISDRLGAAVPISAIFEAETLGEIADQASSGLREARYA